MRSKHRLTFFFFFPRAFATFQSCSTFVSADITKRTAALQACWISIITFHMGKLRLRDKNAWAKVPGEVSGMRWGPCGLLPNLNLDPSHSLYSAQLQHQG